RSSSAAIEAMGRAYSLSATTGPASTWPLPPGSSACSKGCIRRRSSRAPASDWPRSSGSFVVTADASGPKEKSVEGPPSISPWMKGISTNERTRDPAGGRQYERRGAHLARPDEEQHREQGRGGPRRL